MHNSSADILPFKWISNRSVTKGQKHQGHQSLRLSLFSFWAMMSIPDGKALPTELEALLKSTVQQPFEQLRNAAPPIDHLINIGFGCSSRLSASGQDPSHTISLAVTYSLLSKSHVQNSIISQWSGMNAVLSVARWLAQSLRTRLQISSVSSWRSKEQVPSANTSDSLTQRYIEKQITLPFMNDWFFFGRFQNGRISLLLHTYVIKNLTCTNHFYIDFRIIMNSSAL